MQQPTSIDVHTHYVPRQWPDLRAVTDSDFEWPWLRIENERDAVVMFGTKDFRKIQSDAWDAEVRLADMDAAGVDIQVVSPTPAFFSYAAPADDAVKVSRIFNDLALEICAPAPERLLPFAQVPLQDIDAACAELDRCMALGHAGVEIGNHVGDRDLDDAQIVTFLQHCAAIGAPVFVHPWDMADSPRLQRWMAQWLTGMPAETHLSILALILGGTLDRVSSDLKLCFAHGGGSFAFWVGRMDNAWHRRPDLVATSEHPPSHYLSRFSVDSAVFEPNALRLLVDTMGTDNVMLGSDYPYPLGEQSAGSLIRSADFLDDQTRNKLLRGNAEQFLGLPSPVNEPSIAPLAATPR
ncbi:MAG: aminocarboxymuconate-semialdehyde decarboxylase [Cryobacterium sp.]|nr:aminocarboxymuconate-semialdehyde decarboxylase [Cryobacterium sp.]